MKYMNQMGRRPIIKKTRGTQRGSLNSGPRGQSQSFINTRVNDNTGFRRFDGTSWQRGDRNETTSWQQGGVFNNFEGMPDNGMSSMSVAQYFLGLASVGILFYVIGYSYAEGRKAA